MAEDEDRKVARARGRPAPGALPRGPLARGVPRQAGRSVVLRTQAAAKSTTLQEHGAVLELLRALWGVNHAFGAHSWRMKRRLGVTGVERMVVRLVGRHPGITPGDLARFLHLHPSTLTAVLKRLVQRKVLLRKADTSDARRGRLTLAARGVALDGVQRGTVEAAVKAALDHVAPRDVRTASAVLELVKQALERPARGESWGAVSGERAWTGPAPASEVALAAGGARRRG